MAKITQQVHDEDFRFLALVSGMQKALISSSVCPVVVWKKEEGEQGYALAMYYDCTEDEKTGLSVMKKRIQEASADILEHFKLHRAALESFLEMDGAIIMDARPEFADACSKAIEKTRQYSRLVEKHLRKHRTNNREFLVYPSCLPGHYFHILNGSNVCQLGFNPHMTAEGLEHGLHAIERGLVDFKIRQNPLPYITMAFSLDDGAGFYDASFRQNLGTTAILLERAGLKV